MILKTIHGKLSLIMFGLLCLLGCLSIPLTLLTMERYQQEVNQNLNRPLAASLATHLADKNLLSLNPPALEKARIEIKHLMVINPNIDVYLLDEHGTVLAYSGNPGEIQRSRITLTPLRQFLGRSSLPPIFGDDPRTSGGQKVFSVATIPLDTRPLPGQYRGYVYVILGGKHYTSVAGLLGRSYVLRSSVLAVSVTFALIPVVGLLLFRLLTRRLRHLTLAMESFQERGYQEGEAGLSAKIFIPESGVAFMGDDIDRLGAVYVQMAHRIRGQIQELDRADMHRREMVSNVSHDLRTPLAALHGYLETLLMKEGSLTVNEQREYLQTAIRHSERLSKLVSELFELAQLDSREVQVHPEQFSLSELVQDVTQQYQLAAQQRTIQLQALLPESLPFVYADIGLIERVLDNLLENALRYTPEGGAVTISLALQTDRVKVEVADTGSGIPAEHLHNIFERFYRVPDQPDKPGCAGLGLAIAKRILELHGSNIEVASIVEQGTTFTFALPIDEPHK